MPSSARPKSNTEITFGWCRRLATSASRLNRSKNVGAAASDGFRVLIATLRFIEVWVASKTIPMPPWPSIDSTL